MRIQNDKNLLLKPLMNGCKILKSVNFITKMYLQDFSGISYQMDRQKMI